MRIEFIIQSILWTHRSVNLVNIAVRQIHSDWIKGIIYIISDVRSEWFRPMNVLLLRCRKVDRHDALNIIFIYSNDKLNTPCGFVHFDWFSEECSTSTLFCYRQKWWWKIHTIYSNFLPYFIVFIHLFILLYRNVFRIFNGRHFLSKFPPSKTK